jgi:hypothetical protein
MELWNRMELLCPASIDECDSFQGASLSVAILAVLLITGKLRWWKWSIESVTKRELRLRLAKEFCMVLAVSRVFVGDTLPLLKIISSRSPNVFSRHPEWFMPSSKFMVVVFAMDLGAAVEWLRRNKPSLRFCELQKAEE